jgi:hypothetical protein
MYLNSQLIKYKKTKLNRIITQQKANMKKNSQS